MSHAPCTAALLALMLAGPALSSDFDRMRFTPPDVTLTDGRQQPHPLPDLFATKPVVMTFSYTTCASICPIGNAVMAELDDMLGPDVSILTVTIDPTNDTPAQMARAAAEFGASDRWLWLTGDRDDIGRLLRAVGAPEGPLEFHDPIFVIWSPGSRRIHRSLSIPEPAEIAALLPPA
ncbi:SCO family protein [Paenirhodobacter sp.]|uniref:SCO family protein n=1 Tax=Paenirhodobacter sp. TaxID=1965326 RepID=UPI003B5083EC